MKLLKQIEKNTGLQYLIGPGLIILISAICYPLQSYISYHAVALLLLLTVSVLAMFFETMAIVFTAVISALLWNFLFLQPQETFKIGTSEDVLLFLMFAVIAIVNAVFTSRLRKMEQVERQKIDREKSLHLYNTFLNSLSHELKTPISAIIAAVDTLKINSDQLNTKQQNDLISEIDIAGHRLHQQVKNLLSMSRLESPFFKLQQDWQDINELVHRVIQQNSDEDKHRELLFHSEEDLPLFKLDGALLEQIIQNLLRNALQYSPPGSNIQIFARHVKGGLALEVLDNGPGIPEDKQEQVFNRFYRLPKTAAGGTGLGLSIVQGFVKAHNGKIELKNRPEGGAAFRLFIPAEITPATTDE